MQEYLDFILPVVNEAGALAKNLQSSLKETRGKNPKDLVTEADIQVDQMLRSAIQAQYPEHGLLTEEHETVNPDSDYMWVIDPIDGTVNYSRGLPIWALSLALVVNGESQLGIIFSPASSELYTAIKGEGAFLNEQKITVSQTKDLGQALIAISDMNIGPDQSIQTAHNEIQKEFFNQLGPITMRTKMLGSAAYESALVASGRLDAYLIRQFNPWDMAAAWILVEEAGGELTEFNSNKFNIKSNNSLVSNKILHSQLLEIIK